MTTFSLAATTTTTTTATTTTITTATPAALPSFRERAHIAYVALRTLLQDHNRLDQVLVFTQAVNAGMVRRAVKRIEKTDDGRRLLADHPRIDREHVDFDALRRLSNGTLGREYVRFLDDNKIGPEPFEKLPQGVGEREAWMMLRMRQTHDLWHVLTGYRPDVNGELLLQAFTYAQVGAPSALILALGGSLRYVGFSWRQLRALRGAYRRGKATQFLPTFRWEEHWDRPITDLRAQLTCPSEA